MNREEVAEVYERHIQNQLDHAHFNEHILAPSCQGVGPGEFPPAVRSSNVEAAIEGARRELGLPVPVRVVYYASCVPCKRAVEFAIPWSDKAARDRWVKSHDQIHNHVALTWEKTI